MKTRIISAVIAIILLAGVLILHNTIVFNIALSLIGALMVYEVIRAVGIDKDLLSLVSSVVFVFAIPLLVRFNADTLSYALLIITYISVMMLASFRTHHKFDISSCYIAMFEVLLIATSMASLALIERECGAYSLRFLILTLCGAWLSDTGAYFVGTFFGKHKLCPSISPKKTVEGLIGGFISDSVLFLVFGALFLTKGGTVPNYMMLAVMGLICGVLGVIGDLSASLIKRKFSIKDFGNIMPGHGGAMDRFDSVIFVAPFMAAVLTSLPVVI